jgi:hypothetical protein
MEKKSVFYPADYTDLRRRIESLQSGAVRKWGRMDAAQMLAHCNVPLEAGLGLHPLPSEGNFLTRSLLKWYVLRKTSLKPGLPTSPNFVITGERDLLREKQRLLDNLEEAHRRALDGPWHPHNLFGPLRPEEWGILLWLHTDHHLKQFSV